MENTGRTVIGVFEEREDAVRQIQKLHNEGYKRSEISVFGNPERARTVERLMGIHVDDVDTSDVEEDDSWWDTIKDSFNYFVFNADENRGYIHPIDDPMRERNLLDNAAKQETMDILEPYKKDLAAGKLVIVVENDKNRHRS